MIECPKCKGTEIHTWILCVCYKCGYSGDISEFNATQEEIQRNRAFRQIITDMQRAKELGLSLHEVKRKNKKNTCAKCGKQEFKRLMFIANIIDGLTFRHTITKYYCIECSKLLFGELPK